MLVHLFHFFNRTVTSLALRPTRIDVLGMIEIGQVRQVVDATPSACCS